MKVLALDTATHTGWAVHANNVTTSGVEDFSIRTKATKTQPADHEGKRFYDFRTWLHRKVREDKIDLIVYEMVVGGRNAGGKTSLIQKGLEALVLEVAYDSVGEPLPVWTFAAATIKKFATGNGQLTHESKAQMCDTALRAFPDQDFVKHSPTKSQPWSVDDNQCDALWILALAQAVIKRAAIDGIALDGFSPDNLTNLAHRVTHTKWSHPSKSPRR
jgi:hypothetical protein